MQVTEKARPALDTVASHEKSRAPVMVPRRKTGLLLALAVVAAASIGSAIWVHFFARALLVDAWVYLGAGRVLIQGGDLYAAQIPTPIENFTLGFTYPPLAAELFALAAGLPIRVGAAILTAMSVCALFAICLLAIGAVWKRLPGQLLAYPIPLLAVGVTWLAFTLEPIQQTISFGQVNLVLAGLVAADLLIDRPWWPRGILVGLAAAIKLTPLAFILYFLAGRRHRDALVAAGSFVIFGAAAWLIAPGASAAFWLRDVLSTSRIGATWYSGNQSLRGLIARLDMPPAQSTLIWATVALFVAVLGFLAARHRFASNDRLGAMVSIAAVALLVSPVSWSHHWVWVVPALIWVIGRAIQGRRPVMAILGMTVASVFVVGPQWLQPSGNDAELSWDAWQIIAGDAYVLIALIFVVGAGAIALLAMVRRRASGAIPNPGGDWSNPVAVRA